MSTDGLTQEETPSHLPSHAPPRDARGTLYTLEEPPTERGIFELRDLVSRVEQIVIRVPGVKGS